MPRPAAGTVADGPSTWDALRRLDAKTSLATFSERCPALAAGDTWTIGHHLHAAHPLVQITRTDGGAPVVLASAGGDDVRARVITGRAYAPGELTATVTGGRRTVLRDNAQTLLGWSRAGQPWHSGATAGYGQSGSAYPIWAGMAGGGSDFVEGTSDAVSSGQTAYAVGFTAQSPFSRLILNVRLGNDTWMPTKSTDAQTTMFNDIVAGSHDDIWSDLAQQLASKAPNAIVRLGWEFNGGWYSHGIGDTGNASGFVAAWRHARDVIRATAPGTLFMWDISANAAIVGYTDPAAALGAAYPGDAYVDICGVDFYDNWDRVTTGSTFDDAILRPTGGKIGMGHMLDFARAHGKPFAVPEWGVVDANHNGAGDNPDYVRRMRHFFESTPELVLEAYWDSQSTDDFVTSIRDSSTQFPNAQTTYRELWGAA